MQTENSIVDSPGFDWRRHRLARGLSLREVARNAAIDPAHLSRVERGRAQLSIPAALRLAETLELEGVADVLRGLVGSGR